MSAAATYSAWFDEGGQPKRFVYRGVGRGNLVGELPAGTRPLPAGECGSLDRTDGGDAFERAYFVAPSGRTIIVARDAVANARPT